MASGALQNRARGIDVLRSTSAESGAAERAPGGLAFALAIVLALVAGCSGRGVIVLRVDATAPVYVPSVVRCEEEVPDKHLVAWEKALRAKLPTGTKMRQVRFSAIIEREVTGKEVEPIDTGVVVVESFASAQGCREREYLLDWRDGAPQERLMGEDACDQRGPVSTGGQAMLRMRSLCGGDRESELKALLPQGGALELLRDIRGAKGMKETRSRVRTTESLCSNRSIRTYECQAIGSDGLSSCSTEYPQEAYQFTWLLNAKGGLVLRNIVSNVEN